MHSERDPFRPIAIIGMGMRLPGNVATAEDFWDFLINKKDGRCRVPKTRYNADGFMGQNSKKETIATEYGYFLQDVNLKAFDTSFFKGNRVETPMMDPQQRLLLEVVWECMENAGQANLAGTNTGVYVGSYGEDWNQLVHQDTQGSNVYRVLNSSDFILSNRISKEFDLQGPSMTIRTACSAAVTGLHLACQALHNEDCTTAIVAGSNLILSPSMTQDMSAQGVLSSNGICKTFDAAADGYGRAEGVNAIMVKLLDDALRDGDPIRAVIRSTAVNSDGRTSQVGAPSAESQQNLIRHAYKMAGIQDFSETAFVECHGTGTLVGDPVEVAAIGGVFGCAETYIGSVKSNVGHTEGASGITGIIKAVLALENEIIPPNMNLSTLNPKIPFDKYKLKVPTEPTPWPKDRRARASVNCFGIGGANAHVILDSAASFADHSRKPPSGAQVVANGNSSNGVPAVDGDSAVQANGNTTTTDTDRPLLLPVSATSEKTLKKRVADLQDYIGSKQPCIEAVANTLGSHRVHMSHRTFSVTNNAESSLEFEPFKKISASLPDVIFVFTGQGAQWVGMGRDLCRWMPSFRRDIQEMDKFLQNIDEPAQWSIEELLCCQSEDEERTSEAAFSQPLSTAVQLALANALIKCGIKPSAVIGHSSGEIAAAYVAGALTMREAIICSYLRGLAVKRHASCDGRMAAVGLGHKDVLRFLIDGVQVACENSPKSVTLAGTADALDKVLNAIKLEDADIFTRHLRIEVAYHSYQMSKVGPEYEAMLATHLSAKTTELPFYSTVFGHLITSESSDTMLDPAYWRKNLESPVLFDSTMQQLLIDHKSEAILLEIGPHSALRGPIQQILRANASTSPIYIPTLSKDKNSMESILWTIGRMHSQGFAVDFSFVNPNSSILVDLPLYPWDHSVELWKESRISHAWRSREHPHHELLGSSCPMAGGLTRAWGNIICGLDVVWLKDHMVGTDVILPCTGYIAMIGEAIRQTTGSEAYTLRDLVVKSALIIHESETTELSTTMKPLRLTNFTDSSWYEFSICSFNGTSWTQHCIAQGKATEEVITTSISADYVTTPLPRKVPDRYLYEQMDRMGLRFGPCFRLLKDISADTQGYAARASISETERSHDAKYTIHPCDLDACLQLSAVASSKGVFRHLGSLKVPSGISHIDVSTPGGLGLVVEAIQNNEDVIRGQLNVTATTNEGNRAICFKDVKFIPLDTGDNSQSLELSAAAAGRQEWRLDIDFCKVQDLLHTGASISNVKFGLEKVTALCILRFIDEMEVMGVSPPQGHLPKYVAWLQRQKESMLKGEYLAVPEALEWALGDMESRKALLQIESDKLHSIGHYAASGVANMICVIVQPGNIKAVFSEEIHPLQLFLEQDGLVEFYNYYSQLLDGRQFFSLSAHARPNLKILEIGGGTAGTTEVVLNYLVSSQGTRMYSKYTFTDISPGFFANAQERLKNWEGVEYKTLDITQNPSEQGFTLGEYDIVVASNVLHATPSLHETLKNVRFLLRPGGRLYLQELITPTSLRLVNFITGLLSGWWVGENDGRAEEAIVSVERWDQELLAAGFCGVESAVLDDNCHLSSIAHMTSVNPPTPINSAKNVVFLYDNEKTSFSRQLAAKLEEGETTVHWRTIHDREYIECQEVISTLDLEGPFFNDISEESFTSFMAYMSQLKGGILWLSRAAQIQSTDPAYGLVIGIARTLRLEMSMDFWTVELQNLDDTTVTAAASIAAKFFNRSREAARTVDCEFSVHNGGIHIGRYDWSPISAELQPPLEEDAPKQMVVGQPGRLDSIHWVQQAPQALQAEEVEITIRCTGMNFRDIMYAMGLLQVEKDNDSTGWEASGVVNRVGSQVTHLNVGDRVMLIHGGLYATRKVINGKLAFRIPEELSFESAATMALVYCTVIYAIMTKGEFESGQSILIHSACGGVGLAALHVCKMLNANIYATVGSEEKVEYLVEHYGLDRKHIFNSRNASFYDDLMRATNNRGVDLVLNSLSGDLLHASWRCVAKWGKMMEIGKRDIIEKGSLPIDMFSNNRTYYGIALDTMFERPEMLYRLMQQVLQYYNQGHIKPIEPIHVFPADDILGAFRFMRSGQHMGKIVVTMPNDVSEIPSIQPPQEIKLSSSSTYLLVGGLGGLGKAVAAWMVEKGAKSFVFLSRSAGESAEDKDFLQELESQGCSAIAVRGSVVRIEDIEKAIQVAPTPIAGLIQLSMVLRDLPFSEMGYDDWNTVQDPKVKGTWNLHKAMAGVDLDFFILFSSISAVFGQPGQASYSSANAFLASFVQFRHGLGLPCFVIDIGAMEGVGVLTQVPHQEKQFANMGLHLTQEQTLMDAIQIGIMQPSLQPPLTTLAEGVSSRYTSVGQISIGMASSRPLADPGNRHPMRNDIRMGLAWQLERSQQESKNSNNDEIRQLLGLLASDPELLNQNSTLERLTMEIGRTLCSFMMVPHEDLDANTTLESLGVDSLVSIEIRNWWRGTLGVDISVLEINNAGTISRLGALAVTSLKEKFMIKSGDVEVKQAPSIDLAAEFSSYMEELSKFLPSSPESPFSAPTAATVFLTGATGYLGTEILKQLLQHSAVSTVILLVRAKSSQHGVERIRKTAEIAGWWAAEYESRIEIWLGDLAKASLGLNSQQLLRLRGESSDEANVNTIIHNGAFVKLSADYETLRVPNVESTVELLKLMLSNHSSRFIYVSGGFKTDANKSFEAIAEGLATQVGYSQTKIMSERLTVELASKMPASQKRVSVIKPGLIIGSADSGVTNTDDVLWHLVAATAAAKSFPVDSEDRWLYLTGVDDIATRIVKQLFQQEIMVGLEDITDGMLVSKFWELVFEELELPYAAQPWEDWFPSVSSNRSNAANNYAMVALHQLIKDNSSVLHTQQPDGARDLQRTDAALRSSVQYLKRVGFLQSSLHEHKTLTEDTIHRTGK